MTESLHLRLTIFPWHQPYWIQALDMLGPPHVATIRAIAWTDSFRNHYVDRPNLDTMRASGNLSDDSGQSFELKGVSD